MKHFNIAVIAGDGIGPEVIAEGKKYSPELLRWTAVFRFPLRISHGAVNTI